MKTKLVPLIVFAFILFSSFFSTATAFQDNRGKFVVVLDAGHGGKDPGKHSKYGYKEKDIALSIVLSIGAELEKNPAFKVVYTRKTDVFVRLEDRAKIANNADADLFISIHCNAHHTEASGTETYVLDLKNTNRNFEVAKAENEVIFLEEDYEKHYEGFDPHSPVSSIGITLMQEEFTEYSILLASYIERNFVNQIKRKSRGVKQASLWVIHQTAMPSVLIETGFITNKEEGAYLNSAKGKKEVSQSILNAIIDYKKVIDRNVGENIYSQSVTPNTAENVAVAPDEIPHTQDVYPNIVFKVQIAAGSKELDPKPFNFNGLSDISREKGNGVYKYYHGYTSDYNMAKRFQAEAQSKGFNDCFIVAFRDGKQIDLHEALKTTAN
ncbi:MAG TPA: N-acetylmuramoyl-L-alanine amidase [Aquaticitalea sp.]|nr:N-acetylmuramoyl-L-alanine amidase [Aquaticitalea sp.]